MSYNRQAPTVQAGSMADIAFLLLIFFLVATKVPNDMGLSKKLPPNCSNPPCEITVENQNYLEIILGKDNSVFIKDEIVQMSDLKTIVIDFVDNNGDGSCSYCNGNSVTKQSDTPKKAVIGLVVHRNSQYEQFIEIQDCITSAFSFLRENYATKKFGKSADRLNKTELKEVQDAYPFNLSELTIKD